MINSQNLNKFSRILSTLLGEDIDPVENIHIGKGRSFYIQSALDGAPLLLRHYRGPLFIDMSKRDYANIISGSIDAEEYVQFANWMVGYYWGGSSMVGGGYYQPLDIVNRKKDVQRYLKILRCRTSYQSSGYRPTEESCASCAIKNCPFSSAESNKGKWENEYIREEDPRREVFALLAEKFEGNFPGYSLKGFLSSSVDGSIPTNKAFVRANARWLEKDGYTFIVYLSAETIRGLLMHTISIENAKEIVDGITFYHSEYNMRGNSEVTMDTIKEIFATPGMDHPTEVAKAETKRIADEELAVERSRWGIFGFLYDMLHKSV